MMNNFDITVIEEEIKSILRSIEVSDKVYSNRPKSAESASDFVVVKSGDITDKYTYGECMVYIYLFAKDNNYIKNGKKLSSMYSKVVNNFPAESGRFLFDICPLQGNDISDDFGFHRRMIRIQTTIKAI